MPKNLRNFCKALLMEVLPVGGYKGPIDRFMTSLHCVFQ